MKGNSPISNRLHKIINKTRDISNTATMNAMVGACVMMNGKICSLGKNHKDRSRIAHTNVPSVHAEIDAIQGCRNLKPYKKRNELIKIDILIVRYTRNGLPAISRPCNVCIDFLCNLRGLEVNKVYYFNNNGQLVIEKLKNMKRQHISIGYSLMRKNKFVST